MLEPIGLLISSATDADDVRLPVIDAGNVVLFLTQ